MAEIIPNSALELSKPTPRSVISKKSSIRQKLTLGHSKLDNESSASDSQRGPKPKLLNNLLIENTTKRVLDLDKQGINKIHEERKPAKERRPNFHFHGEHYFFATNSLFCLNEKNRFRLFLVKLMTHT